MSHLCQDRALWFNKMFTGEVTQVAHIQLPLKTGFFVPAAARNETLKQAAENMRCSKSQTVRNCYLLPSGATTSWLLEVLYNDLMWVKSYEMSIDKHR